MLKASRVWFGGGFLRFRTTVHWLLLLAPLSACEVVAGIHDRPLKTTGPLVECTVTRRECLAETVAGNIGCATFSAPVTFVAKECFDAQQDADPTATCKRVFCPKAGTTMVLYDYPDDCAATGKESVAPPKDQPGVCAPDSSPHWAMVGFRQTQRDCIRTNPTDVFCSSLSEPPLVNEQMMCRDVSTAGALAGLRPILRDGRVNIFSVNINGGSCPLVGAASGNLAYQLPSGPVGTATAPGTSVTLTSTRGFLSVSESCDSETCTTALNAFRADFADMTVLGNSLTSLTVTNAVQLPRVDLGDGLGVMDPGALKLIALGRVNGVDAVFNVANNTFWQADFTGSGGFRLRGSMDILTTDTTGRLLPVKVSADISATPASAQALACASLPPIQRLFGFEDPMSWTVTSPGASFSLVTAPITQGCGALGISGQGYLPFRGDSFSTVGLTTKPAISVDLFIPTNQPNPSWLGALQMYVTCPSGNVFSQYVGQVELTGRPQGRFSTLRFPVPSNVASTLGRGLKDCSFGLALNVNPTGRTWVLDNLRFTQ